MESKGKVLFISDLAVEGSGYMQISTNLALGLVKSGYEVKCIGLRYNGEEHNHPFSILPCANFQEANLEYYNITSLWKQDITVVALDIVMQERILQQVQTLDRKPPYIGIFPVEGDPLCMDWALVLSQMQGRFCISQFGTEECRKAGIEAEHIQIGIDTEAWRPPLPGEREALRKAMGFEEDDLIILTVADNQERKNLSSAIHTVSELEKRLGRPVKYVMVTREFQPTGYKLRSLAQELGYQNLVIYERGLGFKELLGVYMMSDLFFLSSLAEGLCMPVLEAQATGLPVFATDCTALHELLEEGKGTLLPVEFKYRDVFGNSHRYFYDENQAIDTLYQSIEGGNLGSAVDLARAAVVARSWDVTNAQLDNKIEELLHE